MESERNLVDGALAKLAPVLAPGARAITGLRRLTGGASMETWAFEAIGPTVRRRLILRRRGGTPEQPTGDSLPFAVEAALLRSAGHARIPVPELVWTATDEGELGEAYIVAYVEGETLGSRIVKHETFAPARAVLGGQCGGALARIHAMPLDPGLPTLDGAGTLAHYQAIWRRAGLARPAIEAGFRWLRDSVPSPVPPRLLHGDFRTGNLMVDPAAGLVAILDWELSHLGDPAEDLGWLSVPSWRFGRREHEAGGFAALPELLEAYAAAGGEPLSIDRVRWWQAMGSLKWAVMSNMLYRAGGSSPERMVIGRRLSECEADLIAMMRA